MVDVEDRLWAWWNDLDAVERLDAMTVMDVVPDWMVESLSDARLMVVAADRDGHGRAMLMSTHVRGSADARPIDFGRDLDALQRPLE
jgi:hypothetical protein